MTQTAEGSAEGSAESSPESTASAPADDAAHTSAARRPAPFLLLAAVTSVLVAARAASRPLDDIDLYWHILVGREILSGTPIAEAGRGWSFAPVPDTWISTQWLAEVLFARLHDTFGFGALLWFRLLTTVLALAVLAAVTLYRRPARAAAWPFALAGLALAMTGQERSQQLTYILAPLVGWWGLRLWRDGRLPRWWVVLPLVVVWANVHGGWVLVPMMLVLAAIARVIDHGLGERRVVLGAVLLAAGTAVAACISPSGIGNVIAIRRFSEATANIAEWGAVRTLDWNALAIGVLLLTVVIAWALGKRRPTAGEVVLVLGLFVFGYTAWRSSTPACLMLAPIVVGTIARAIGDDDPLPEGVRNPGVRLSWAVVGIGSVLVAFLAATQTQVTDPDIPVGLLTKVQQASAPQRVLNTYNISGPLLFYGGPPPHVLVAVDGRADRYGGAYIERYTDVLMLARPGWQDMLDELAPTAAVLRVKEPLAEALVSQKGWVEVARDNGTVLLHAPGAPGWPAASTS